MNNTLKFIGYYLAPFVLNCVSVFLMWNASTITVVFIIMAVTFLGNMLWAWFTPNERALPTALLVAVSWLYAWTLLLLFYESSASSPWSSILVSVFSALAFLCFGCLGAVFGFVGALVVGNEYLRFNNEKRGNVWQVTVTAMGLKILVCILMIPLCIAVVLSCIKGPPASKNNSEVWIDYSEYEQMNKE